MPPLPTELNQSSLIAAGVNRSLSIGTTQLWAGEIGPHNGQSPRCDHTSMRWANFADSFWYLDAMGTHARHGYSVFCRQDFVGIAYGMVDCATYDPLPDYYSGIMWSMLMGPAVLQVDSNESHVRAYAHCSAGDAAQGGLSLLLINLAPATPNNVSVHLPGSGSGNNGDGVVDGSLSATAYVLTGPGGMNATAMALNGDLLQMTPEGTLPPITGRNVLLPWQSDGSVLVTLPNASIVFLHISAIKDAGC